MSAQQPADTRLAILIVTVTGTNLDLGTIMCRDPYGFEFEISATIRMKGAGIPAAGEQWVLSKMGNSWIPQAQIGAAVPQTISGSRIGLPDVLLQLLNAAAASGLVIDATDVIPVVTVPDPNPTSVDQYLPPDPPDPDGSPTPVETGPLPVQIGPLPVPPPVIVIPPVKPPTSTWLPIYTCSYNTLKDLGPQTAYSDLIKLSKTKVQIIGLQEAHNNNRDADFNRLSDQGWSNYRPKTSGFSDEDTILWRTDEFSLLDSGCIYLGQYSIPSARMPPRYLNWVKLNHNASGRDLYFMDTHFDPFLDQHNGHPRTAADLQNRIQMHFGFIAAIASHMKAFGAKAPVFTAGDLNINLIDDAKVRYPKFPYAAWGAVQTRSNWDSVTVRPPYGTIGGHLYYDAVWLTRGPQWSVTPIDNWILTGYHSDHKPVLVRYQIKSKSG